MRATAVGDDVTRVDIDTSFHVLIKIHVLGALADDSAVVGSAGAVKRTMP